MGETRDLMVVVWVYYCLFPPGDAAWMLLTQGGGLPTEILDASHDMMRSFHVRVAQTIFFAVCVFDHFGVSIQTSISRAERIYQI
ncbi:MAG: hypothetical protein ACSHXH_14790 [Marivita sp.]